MPYASLQEYRQKAQTFDFNGHQVAWWQAGEGPDLLLVHGFPSASWDWHKLWPALTARFRVTACDMLGYGLSAKPFPHTYSILEQAELVGLLARDAGIERGHVLAHDYGDSVTQEMLTRQTEGRLPFEMQSVVFLNGGLFPESHRALLTQKLLAGPLGGLISRLLSKRSLKNSFTRIFGRETPPEDAEIDALWTLLNEHNGRRIMKPMLFYLKERLMYRDRWVHAMQSQSVPMIFVNGVEDPISGGHMLEQFQALLPECPSAALKAGHYPQLEVPDAVLQAFDGFHAEHLSAE